MTISIKMKTRESEIKYLNKTEACYYKTIHYKLIAEIKNISTRIYVAWQKHN